MTLTTLVVAYVFGGLTFIPLLLAAVLIPAWFLLPQIVTDTRVGEADHTTVGGNKGEGTAAEVAKEKPQETENDKYASEGAASGTFAVLRSYHFQSAIAALNGRNNVNASNTASTNGTVDGSAENNGNSESVYQSMYRSVFDRSKNVNMAASVLENREEDAAAGATVKAKSKAVGASVFYIVLRHGHLMLYDTAAQLDPRHVISLAHHSISLSDGELPEEQIMDADLFIKRTAIVLTPVLLPNGHLQSPASRPKPFYLFSSTCSEKEDFYHALLYTRALPPVPRSIQAEDIIKLQSLLHSTSLTPETRAFNALIGRIFLGIHRTPFLQDLVRSKIEKKISRVQKPAFIASISVKSIDLGDSAPVISNVRLKDINISGDLTLGCDLRYNGGVQVVISALAKIDLGSRFKTRTVDLVLATSLNRLHGHMLFRVKPTPSNRIWFCFDGVPEMDIKIEPIVSQRQITYAFILRAIEERIRSVVTETLVKPNWDDVPFFSTLGQTVRGGIWSDEGSADVPTGPSKGLDAKNEKSRSMPALPIAVDATDSSAASSGSENVTIKPSATSSALTDPPVTVKRRSLAAVPVQQSAASQSSISVDQILPPPKPLRSPSFTSPSPSAPSVAMGEADVVPVRADDAELQPKKWRSRASLQTQTRKEAVEAIREMRDRSMPALETVPSRKVDPDEVSAEDDFQDPENLETAQTSRRQSDSTLPGSPRRTDSDRSTLSSHSTASRQHQPQQRKTVLAATAAATAAAKNWSWNAIANRTNKLNNGGPPRQQALFRGAGSPSSSQVSLSNGSPPLHQQPIGRGQPLPPPGTPLPGPQKTLWSAAASGLGGVAKGSVRRKPVPALPPRRNAVQSRPQSSDAIPDTDRTNDFLDTNNDPVAPLPERTVVEDEFGPWSENTSASHATVDVAKAEDLEAEAEDAEVTPITALPAGDEVPVVQPAEDGIEDVDSSTKKTLVPMPTGEEEHDLQGIGKAAEDTPTRAKKVPPPLPARRGTHRKPVPPHMDPTVSEPMDHSEAIPAERSQLSDGVAAEALEPPPHEPAIEESPKPSTAAAQDVDEGVGPNGFAESEGDALDAETKFVEGEHLDEADFEHQDGHGPSAPDATGDDKK